MTWESLFDRASEYETTVEEVRATLQQHRAGGASRDGTDEEGPAGGDV